MNESWSHSDSICINASPVEVYAVVSDVTRTGEWSPVCEACWWDAGDGPTVGAYFTGRNVTPDRTWETRSQVIVADEGRSFGWSVGPGRVRWIYHLAAVEAGTELTQTWEFTPEGHAFFVERFGSQAPQQIADRAASARDGIAASLRAIRRIIEQ